MKDKPATIVFLVVLACIIVTACLCVVLVMFYPRNKTVSPPATATLPNISATDSSPIIASPPELSITVSPDRLMEGVEARIHVRLTNPGGLDLNGYTLLVGYGPQNDMLSVIAIQTIPLTSEVGELFEKDIIWQVDYIPDNRDYAVELSLLDPGSFVLDEISVAVEFVEPTLVISVTPTELTPNSEATIRIQVKNPGDADMNDYTLLLGYAANDDAEMFSIRDITFSLAAGEVLEQDIRWDERFVPHSGQYELRMVLLLPDGTVFTETMALFILIPNDTP